MDSPNILWIGFDQIRFDTLGWNGNSVCQTPNLDRLGSEGVSFSSAYTPCSLCTPARASMFTGLYAFRHGMGTNCDMYHALAEELPEPQQLLHTHFQENGYRCGYLGKWHVGKEKGPSDYGFEGMNLPGYGDIQRDPGFKSYLQHNGLSYTPEPQIYLNPDNQTLIGGRWGGPVESTPAHYITARTMEMIDRCRSSGTPFFITCQYWGPHGPYMPPDEFCGRHNREELEPWPSLREDLSEKPYRIRRELDDFFRDHPKTWQQAREIVGLYYDQTAMLDYEVGRLLDYLEDRGLRDSTIVVFSTDHGDMTGCHGGMMDKGLLYEEAHHIPLIFSWPGQWNPGRRQDLALNMDIMPTLIQSAGLSVPGDLDGTSLLDALIDRPERVLRQDLYLEFHGLRFLYSQRALVTDDGWKYIFTPGDRDEVYDLNNDPAEMNNLCFDPEAVSKVAELQERIRLAAARFNDPLQDCLSKFFGIWYTQTGQIDASKFFDNDGRTARVQGKSEAGDQL